MACHVGPVDGFLDRAVHAQEQHWNSSHTRGQMRRRDTGHTATLSIESTRAALCTWYTSPSLRWLKRGLVLS